MALVDEWEAHTVSNRINVSLNGCHDFLWLCRQEFAIFPDGMQKLAVSHGANSQNTRGIGLRANALLRRAKN